MAAAQVLEKLRGGAAVALVSDAGMPGVSDPGALLAAAAVQAGITVVPVPGADAGLVPVLKSRDIPCMAGSRMPMWLHAGPSAVLAALVASGLATDAFQFAGFLPPKASQRLKRLEQLAGPQLGQSMHAWINTYFCRVTGLMIGGLSTGADSTLIIYAPPHSLAAVLADMAAVLGGQRRCVIAREITKVAPAPPSFHEFACRVSFESIVGEHAGARGILPRNSDGGCSRICRQAVQGALAAHVALSLEGTDCGMYSMCKC